MIDAYAASVRLNSQGNWQFCATLAETEMSLQLSWSGSDLKTYVVADDERGREGDREKAGRLAALRRCGTQEIVICYPT